jgi:hypothetical protein|tara:strand:+ start:320 stop:1420 length:1101 start_codon:yes stop_codon:yes gene_type:complete
MAFKMPGLLKSPAFGVGAFKAINVRYDRMAENAEKYKLAAQKRGAELFAEHKATKNRLKVENEAKQYVAAQFTPELADYLDSTGSLGFTVGMDTKDFLEQVDAEAQKVMGAGGVPETFTANENMYYGDQRFEEYEQSYGKVKNFMDTQNNVFGDSFGMLMEENTPEKMTKEQFGVTARADITSLERSGLAAKEITDTDLINMNKMVDQNSAWPTKGFTKAADGTMIPIFGDAIQSQVSTAKILANSHFKHSTGNISDAATQGIILTKNIVGFADKSEDFQSLAADVKGIKSYLDITLAGARANPTEFANSFATAVDLYFFTVAQKTKPHERKALQEDITELRKQIEDSTGIRIPVIFGADKPLALI